MQRDGIRIYTAAAPAGVDLRTGVFADGDLLRYAAAAAQIQGVYRASGSVASAFTGAGASLTDITGLTFSAPRAGTYDFEFWLQNTLSAQPSTIGIGINASANFTSIAAIAVLGLTATTFAWGTQTANNTAITGSKTVTTATDMMIRGQIVLSGPATIACRAQRSANTLTIVAGSGGYVHER